MTIIGVCGCTSLIIAGFALRDSISSMIPKQFGEINKYNITISHLKTKRQVNNYSNVEDEILQNEQITSLLSANVQSVKIIKDDNNQSIQLIVPNDTNKLNEFITLRDRKKQDNTYTLDNSGVIITEKLSQLLNIKQGDTITLENSDGDRRDVKVANITENYIMHYIYMSPELYNEVFDAKNSSKSNICQNTRNDRK